MKIDGMLRLNLAIETLKKVGGQIVLKVMKTWLNGWVTSHRLNQDAILPCVPGCRDQRDTVKHYIMRPHVHALQRFLLDDACLDPLVRFANISQFHDNQ